jgi:16S rRNA (cytosine967-C5)-methyltransferase
VDLLRGVDERDAYANLLLPALLRERGLTGRDAALATELSYGTLRGQGSYDAVLAVCCDRDLAAIDPPLRQVLRLGAHQLLATRVAPHAAVATSVDLARYVAGPRPAGFVNAVLRRVSTHDLPGWLDIVAPPRAKDLTGHLAVRYSHPRWIVTAMAAALGEDPQHAPDGRLAQTEALLAADDVRPTVTLCAAPSRSAWPARSAGQPAPGGLDRHGGPEGEDGQGGRGVPGEPGGPGSQEGSGGPGDRGVPDGRTDRDHAGDLGGEGTALAELIAAGCKPARWSPYGAYLPEGDPGRLAPVADGRAAVQDEASQLAAAAVAQAETLGTDTGRWLDMCAGPGGKARLLAALAAQRGARLLASDTREHRARLTQTALRPAGQGPAGQRPAGQRPAGQRPAGQGRAGRSGGPADSAVVIAADGTEPAWRAGAFDRVLADVPCSGLGALRRRPESRWRRSPEDVEALGPLQRELLAAALRAVRPGGVVGYITCSPHLPETGAVVRDVLGTRDDFEILDAPAVLAGLVPDAADGDGLPELRCAQPGERFAQFWPHRHGTDAIFLALIRRHP